MGQMSWRAPDNLLDRVRQVAADTGWSMNEYVTRVLEAATDPALADEGAQQTRERLARAGLLAETGSRRQRPDRAELARARRQAGRGTPLSDLVSSGRE
jgi:hypothetical protein